MPEPFCSLCGSTNPADLGRHTGICLDKDACHRRWYIRFRDRAGEATARAEAAEAKLAGIRETVSTFLTVRGGGQGAQDLAEGIRQVLDRDEIGSDGKAAS